MTHIILTLALVLAVSLALCLPAEAADKADSPKKTIEAHVPIRAITAGPKAHWFAYYDKFQFDPTDRYVLGMEVDFEDREPKPDDVIKLGYIDLKDGDKWTQFAETSAWCWQQGCMLQWLPGSKSEVIYNARQGDGYVSIVRDVFTGKSRTLEGPVYTVSGDGKTGVRPSFARLGETRPGYGYLGVADPWAKEAHSEEDGIYAVDIATGKSRLLFSLDQISKVRHDETMEPGSHWFNHLLFNQDGSRFIFLHRWNKPSGKGWYTRMFTAQPDGKDLYCLADHGMVSHFIWRDPEHILAWSTEPIPGNRYHLYADQSEQVEVIGDGILNTDGHCTYSPDGQWVLTDTYPNKERMQTLMLYRPSDAKLVILGKFYQARTSESQLRTDLHPRWSRDGKSVCIDSKCSGQRQLYLLDVSSVVD